jgi:hypothetical protein
LKKAKTARVTDKEERQRWLGRVLGRRVSHWVAVAARGVLQRALLHIVSDKRTLRVELIISGEPVVSLRLTRHPAWPAAVLSELRGPRKNPGVFVELSREEWAGEWAKHDERVVIAPGRCSWL